jgi:hypothetical protein
MTPKEVVALHVNLNITQLINHLREVSDGEHAIDRISISQDFEAAATDEGWEVYSGQVDIQGDVNPTYVNINTDAASFADNYQQLCEEQDIEPHESEAMEYYAVSEALGRNLKGRGEKVAINLYGMNVWARFGSGQGVHMDSVIEDIAGQWL